MHSALLSITPLDDNDIAAVTALWERCGLIGREADRIVASLMVGHDGHRGWVYYVGVDPDCRGKGFGRAIMDAAEDWLRQRGIVKVQLLVRGENTKVQAFYETLGYDEQDRIIYAKWLDGRAST